MLVFKLKIKSISDSEQIAEMQLNYSCAFRKLYSNYDQIKNSFFIKNLCEEYNLDSWQFESLKTDVETKISQVNTIRSNNKNQQEEIKDELEILKNKKTEKAKKITRFKLLKKLAKLSRFKDIVFGSKTLLRKISYLSNVKDEYIDAINTSLEICRRGVLKFVKGSFFPELTKDDIDTMSRLVKESWDVQDKIELVEKVKPLTNWRDLYNLFKQTEVKYRRSLSDLKESFREFSLFSLKSKVILYEFY